MSSSKGGRSLDSWLASAGSGSTATTTSRSHYTASLAIAVHTNTARNGVNPGQQRLARTVGVAHTVDAKPGILQHVARVVGIPKLSRKEAIKLWAELLHQRSRRSFIGLLISHHEILDGGGLLLSAGSRSYGPDIHFNCLWQKSEKTAC